MPIAGDEPKTPSWPHYAMLIEYGYLDTVIAGDNLTIRAELKKGRLSIWLHMLNSNKSVRKRVYRLSLPL